MTTPVTNLERQNLTLIFSVLLYACKSWPLTSGLQIRIQAALMKYFKHLLGILYTDHIMNEELHRRVSHQINGYKDMLSTVKRRKLKWSGSKIAMLLYDCPTRNITRRRGHQRDGWTMLLYGPAKVLLRSKCWPMTGSSGGFLLTTPPTLAGFGIGGRGWENTLMTE